GETVQQVVGGEVQDKGLSVRQQARKRLAFGDGRSFDEAEEQAILVVRQQFAFPADLSAPRGPVGDVGDQVRLLCDDAHGIGGNRPGHELIGEMQPGIGDFQEGEDVVRAVLLEEEIIEIRVAQFPRVHEQPRDLAFRQVKAVLPDVPVLKVTVFLDLDVVRKGRKVALESSEDSKNDKGDLTL